jgi:hypothetical protein
MGGARFPICKRAASTGEAELIHWLAGMLRDTRVAAERLIPTLFAYFGVPGVKQSVSMDNVNVN